MNVIIVMLDSLRPDHLGCYGNKWIRTPNLDQLALESMVFDRAVPETLPTLPVRRGLLTGMRVFPFNKPFFPSTSELESSGATFLGTPHALMPGWEPIPWDLATLGELIRHVRGASAYRTALITDTAPFFMTPAMNYHRGFLHWDFIRGQEGDFYGAPVLAEKWEMDHFVPPWFQGSWVVRLLRRYLANTAKWQDEEDHFAPRVFKAAIQWLEDSRQARDPFFLYVDCWDPHEPWDPPQKYVDLYDLGYEGVEFITPPYGSTSLMTEKELRHMRALYAGEVTMVDAWFGKFMQKLRDLGLLDKTLLIVTSDHGHQLGEHGVSGKVAAAMYNELVNCVLMIRHPQGKGAGQRSNALVVSREGIPLGYEVFAGNRSDVTTVEEIVEKIERQYGTAGRIWVMDRGMVSEETLEYLRSGGRRYIVGTPKSQLKRFERELLTEDWQKVREGLEVKLCSSPHEGETFILCRSNDRKLKEKGIHERFEKRLEKGLTRLVDSCVKKKQKVGVVERRVGRLLEANSRAAGLFRVEVNAGEDGRAVMVWKKVEAWREWAELSEGCYLLRSNIKGWDAEQLWHAYIQLTEAEAAFRIQKGDLRIRPIWHQKAERVQAHILVCFLAYVLWKMIGQMVKRAGLGDEPRRILDEIAQIKVVDIVMPTKQGVEIRKRCIAQPTKAQVILLQKLRLHLPQRLKIYEM